MDVMRRLLQFVRPYASVLVFSSVLLGFVVVIEILTAMMVIPLFDNVLVNNPDVSDVASKKPVLRLVQRYLPSDPEHVVWAIAVALIILTILKGICVYYSNYSMNRVGQKVVTDLRVRLFRHVLNQSMAFFSLNSTGRLMSRMANDVEQIQETVSVSLVELVRESALLVASIAYILIIDWKLALLSLLIAPFAFALTFTMGRRIRAVSLKSREDTATLNDQLQQSITGMRIIKAFGTENLEAQRFQKSAGRLFRSNVKAAAILVLNSPVMEFLAVAAFIPLLLYAHHGIDEKSLSLGLVGSSLYSLFRMYDPVRKISRLHVQFQRALASGSRIIGLLDEHMEISDRADARVLDGVRESIEFRNVSFDYIDQNGETRVLRDINLKVNRKQVIAFVGSSGAGKTTLVGLIPRFYDPTTGAVLIDGTDIRERTQNSLRNQIAIVTQETFLFNDTVRNNIAYGRTNASEEEISRAARAALAEDFILRFPMKYETVIGERGQRLSGGERQRISIARALLKNAPILILDEATSALDSESEKLVQQALANLIRDRTTFVIAHRLSTIREADMILVMDRGRIVESGTHDSLMKLEGAYRKFFRLQMEEAAFTGLSGSGE